MKRKSIRIYTTPELYELIEQKAYLFGLSVSQYVKYLIIKNIDPKQEYFSQDEITKNRVDD